MGHRWHFIYFFIPFLHAATNNIGTLVELTQDHNNRSYREQECVKNMLKNYSNSVRPKGTPRFHPNGTIHISPAIISVTVWLVSLSSFDDVTMEFTAQLNFQQEWHDERLIINESYFTINEYIALSLDQEVWKPDTFFQNEQEGHTHSIDQPNQFMKIRRNGMVQYRKRLTMAFSCPMNLMLFPHDNQTCVIEFSSYAYTTTDIVYKWNNESVIFKSTASDSLPKFAIKQVGNGGCDSNTATGNYSCLRIKLILQREFSFFLMQLYIPSCMLVSVSCVSFWIDWRSAPARVPLTIVTLLTVTTQANGINSSLPPVSYTKAIDIWIGACVVFVFGALIEYAIVNYVGSNEEKSRAKLHFKHKTASHDRKQIRNTVTTNTNVARRVVASQQNMSISYPDLLTQATNLYPSLGNLTDEQIGPWIGLRQWRRQKFIPVLQYLKQQQQQREEEEEEEEEAECDDSEEFINYRKKMMISSHAPMGESQGPSNQPTIRSRAERIDIMARILFPIGFVAFNVVYWSLYMPNF